MAKLDDIVIGEVSRRILQPDRLLQDYLRASLERDDGSCASSGIRTAMLKQASPA